MVECPSCSSENAHQSKFCSSCGAALKPEFEATLTHSARGDDQDGVPAAAESSPSDSSQHGRFLPGTKFADRYRIVSLLGKGGMGEVYRADDLKLGHTVALKFLPRELADDSQRHEYFHTEVRLSRQISHPNVCRVYDIGEVDGQHFLSMEYIDGEDLKCLLRRIGRLPKDKGVQVAQQLCAGLAAAHDRGVLHRDLKPANIMIDGRGQVRITDFGLAKLVDDGQERDIAGTPAYMAPEQLTRGEATIQTDLYSLGSILYEVFTGKPVHKTGSIPDLMRAHEQSSPSRPSSFVDDMDPAVERIVLRCLEKEPQDRPKSAYAIAAALPGGDPLAAALAAGDTPSPEMVAAAGGSGLLSLRSAGLCLATAVVGLICFVPLAGHSSPTRGLDRGPEAFAGTTHDILEKLGLYDPGDRPKYQAAGFLRAGEDAAGLEFWYRQSPHSLIPTPNPLDLRTSRVVSLTNPPALSPGMVSVRLNQSKKLRELLVIPETEEATRAHPVAERDLLDLAGLDVNQYARNDQSDWTPPLFADEVYSFEPVSADDDSPQAVSRVNVAELKGQIIFFHVVEGASATPQTWRGSGGEDRVVGYAMSTLITFLTMILAWRNILAGRSDIRGAWRVALFMFVLDLAKSLLLSSHSMGTIATGLRLALATGSRWWIYYVAMEPLARRFWPEMLIAWSRSMTGRFQDPSVGRGILFGTATGVVFTLVNIGVLGLPLQPAPSTLSGTHFLLAQLLNGLMFAVRYSLYFAVTMVFIRLVVRSEWLAALITVAIFIWAWHDLKTLEYTVAVIAYYTIVAAFLARQGILAASSFMFCHELLRWFPMSNDWQGPDVITTALAVVAIGACALYGFYISVGGRSSFSNTSTTEL